VHIGATVHVCVKATTGIVIPVAILSNTGREHTSSDLRVVGTLDDDAG
jgi:hypothetical protein